MLHREIREEGTLVREGPGEKAKFHCLQGAGLAVGGEKGLYEESRQVMRRERRSRLLERRDHLRPAILNGSEGAKNGRFEKTFATSEVVVNQS
jgi:hypothetical protein